MKELALNYGFGEIITYFIERKMNFRLPINPKTRWKWNIKSEIRFWDKCIRTNGLIWKDEYKLRLDPNLPLQDEIIKFLPEKDEINILDVGAGPLTYLGKTFGKVKINIDAVDPLADEYDKILDKYNVVPKIRTVKLDAEKLTSKYSPNSFDFVFARNCIDHSYSPEYAILEMLEVVKQNHFILLKHRPNEALKEDWQGLHQWNFSESDGDFIISSNNERLNFSEQYKNICKIKCVNDYQDDMLNTIIYKI